MVVCQAPLSMGILQARILKWVAMHSSRESFQPGDRTQISCIPGGFITIQASRDTGVGSLSRFFLTQELNQGLLHCTWVLPSWVTREALVAKWNLPDDKCCWATFHMFIGSLNILFLKYRLFTVVFNGLLSCWIVEIHYIFWLQAHFWISVLQIFS